MKIMEMIIIIYEHGENKYLTPANLNLNIIVSQWHMDTILNISCLSTKIQIPHPIPSHI